MQPTRIAGPFGTGRTGGGRCCLNLYARATPPAAQIAERHAHRDLCKTARSAGPRSRRAQTAGGEQRRGSRGRSHGGRDLVTATEITSSVSVITVTTTVTATVVVTVRDHRHHGRDRGPITATPVIVITVSAVAVITVIMMITVTVIPVIVITVIAVLDHGDHCRRDHSDDCHHDRDRPH